MYCPDAFNFKPIARLLNSLSKRCRSSAERRANQDGFLFKNFALKMFHGNLRVDMIKHVLSRINLFGDTVGEARSWRNNIHPIALDKSFRCLIYFHLRGQPHLSGIRNSIADIEHRRITSSLESQRQPGPNFMFFRSDKCTERIGTVRELLKTM